MTTRRKFLSLACGSAVAPALAGFPTRTMAQTSHSVTRMLVGFGAGGAIDVVARMLVETMKDDAASFIVDNRAGACGHVALGALKAGLDDATSMLLLPASDLP